MMTPLPGRDYCLKPEPGSIPLGHTWDEIDEARRTADGRTKREIIRCLKRFLAREIYQRVMTDFRTCQAVIQAA